MQKCMTQVWLEIYKSKIEKVYGTDGMGQTAENLVDLYKISREDQDLLPIILR